MPRLGAFAPEIFGAVEPFTAKRLPCLADNPKRYAPSTTTPATHPPREALKTKRQIRAKAPGKQARIFLYLRQNGRCWFCGTELIVHSATIDHLTPVSRGGGNDWHNLVLSCGPCNSHKKDLMLEEYRQCPRVSLKDSNRLFYGERV